jgi:peptidyl-prolyl cis-trans isomerase SurA
MKRTRWAILATLLGTVIAVSATAVTTARAEVIERVVAVINDQPIFLSELRRRAAPFLSQPMSLPSQTARMAAIQQLYEQLLDRMVQEELFIQAADRMSVSVTTTEIDRAIGNVQRQSRLSEPDFWEAVRGQGFTREQYRADVRRQLLRLKVLNNYARNRVNITEEQVRERYEMSVARARRSLRYQADQIMMPVAAGASATEIAAARARAEQVRSAIRTAEDFGRAMAEVGGGSLGWLTEGALPEAIETEVLALEEGEISEPLRGPAGFHIFLLRERQAAAEGVPTYEQARMPIFQQMMEEAMGQQEQLLLGELRRQAVIDVRL